MCEYNSNIIDRLIPPPPTNFDVGHNGSPGGGAMQYDYGGCGPQFAC